MLPRLLLTLSILIAATGLQPYDAMAPSAPPQEIVAVVNEESATQVETESYLVTAYSQGVTTANGDHVTEGVTIACPRELPFGTQIYVPSMDHTYTCQDRGGMIRGKHIDIYVTSERRALKFGKQTLDIQIIGG
ncbi:3D domain-containing protein [Paenibacillus hexagrammi]|uniref:3D domain-containing protein n=1 Tax=Paenibacillus hexagrammi TaxID=2908839 RepID=A0ABY3SU49_9BACL|nr:3D domain-containing protein [Paenibacillus sp. YPD9-1]UJF36595.1 3D domain-containing protein [Paenibacillus sp. YPD9-1]